LIASSGALFLIPFPNTKTASYSQFKEVPNIEKITAQGIAKEPTKAEGLLSYPA